MNEVRQPTVEPPAAQPPADLVMRAYATDHGTTYQAETITIKNYGDGPDVRQAAVVTALPAAGEGREGVFVGRDQLSAAVLARLDPSRQAPADPAVTIISGLPGVGKTALARHVAGLALGRDWFTSAVSADFHGYAPDPQARVVPCQLFGSFLRALDVSSDQIPIPVSEQAAVYHRTLSSMAKSGRRVLLLFDNVSSQEQVNDLLPETRAHRVLITSRHTLGEIGNVRVIELGTLPQDEAIEVLAEVLRERDPADARISAHPADAGNLAELCGRLPLALRISGALLAEDQAMPIASLVEDLKVPRTRLDDLVYGELAVSAAFDLSWRQLLERNEPAARLFVELPGNPGPEISSEAAAALIEESESVAQRLLRVLRRCHLIEPGTTANRWHLHDLLRLYADKHRESDTSHDHKAAVGRLLRYYLARANASSDRLLGLPQSSVPPVFADRDEALAWLDTEQPNLTASVLLAEETGRYKTAADLALAISPFLRWRRHFADYVVIGTAGVRAAGLLGDPRRQAMAISNLGLVPQEPKMTDEVLDSLRAECRKYQASGERDREVWALANLGTALAARGRGDEAIGIAERVSELFADLNDHPHEAWSLTMLGLQFEAAGRTSEAIAAHERAGAVFRQVGDRDGEAWALTNLSASLRTARRFDEAVELGRQAGEIFRAAGDLSGQGAALVNNGIALLGLRRLEQAWQVLDEACAVLRAAGDRQREAGAMNSLGLVLSELGCRPDAIRAHERAIAMFGEIANRSREASSRADLGVALRESGRNEDARHQWRLAIDIFRQIGADADADRVRNLAAEGSGATAEPAAAGGSG